VANELGIQETSGLGWGVASAERAERDPLQAVGFAVRRQPGFGVHDPEGVPLVHQRTELGDDLSDGGSVHGASVAEAGAVHGRTGNGPSGDLAP
jgi:hypothetical protein